MQGRNDLVINQATMIEAVQFWLDSQLKEKVTVVSVEKESSSYDRGFKVSISSDVHDAEEA